jgi:hypothetical protein
MEDILGVPFSRRNKFRYTLTVYRATGNDPKASLNISDGMLDVISGRASALSSAVGVFLAGSILVLDIISSPLAKFFVSVGCLGLLAAVVMILSCIWISWASDPKVYKDPKKEFIRSQKIVYRRSIVFNASIVLSAISIAISVAALVGDSL